MQIEHAELSLLGNREENQDRVAIAADDDAVFIAVVDGMGGHADGARAADAAIRTMLAEFGEASRPLFDPDGLLHLTMGRAHEAVVALGRDLPLESRPRATCAVCLVQGGSAFWAHVGDSRIYLLRRAAWRSAPATTATSSCCCAPGASRKGRRTTTPCAITSRAASAGIRRCPR